MCGERGRAQQQRKERWNRGPRFEWKSPYSTLVKRQIKVEKKKSFGGGGVGGGVGVGQARQEQEERRKGGGSRGE